MDITDILVPNEKGLHKVGIHWVVEGTIPNIQNTELWRKGTQSTFYAFNGIDMLVSAMTSSGYIRLRGRI
jgi:hypothetical protein